MGFEKMPDSGNSGKPDAREKGIDVKRNKNQIRESRIRVKYKQNKAFNDEYTAQHIDEIIVALTITERIFQ
ncbi:MAG: hypothetical protein Fur0041_11460 [Bacteroidia bacterium]